MKKLFLIGLLALPNIGLSQLSPPPSPQINLHLESQSKSYGFEPEVRSGPGIILGGASFIVAGLLTTPTMVGGSTTERKPFYKQVRNLPILIGSITLTTGIVITITGN